MNNYEIVGNSVLFRGKEVAQVFKKQEFYRIFLEPKGIDYKKYISKRLEPDNALFVIAKHTLYVIEIKFQNVGGSVDEKLQTCDFKRKQYAKLLHPIDVFVEYYYVLNDWFRKPEYKDTLDYVVSVGCKYFFNEIPLEVLGLKVE